MAFAFDKTVCASGINTELLCAGVPDIEAIALVTGTYPSPPLPPLSILSMISKVFSGDTGW